VCIYRGRVEVVSNYFVFVAWSVRLSFKQFHKNINNREINNFGFKMKTFIVFAFLFICVYAVPKGNLLGAKQCTWGPSYWCSNLTAAAGCHATKHCIQTVWMHKDYPEDNDSVCQTCLDMVKQARDQLESNETQEDIKQVFEGSCKLIPIKIVSKECCKIADDFIPELIDTLASQMNPQVVCSVAGLCNNAKIDKLLIEHEKQNKKLDTCAGCHKVVDLMDNNFNNMSKDDFLKSLLEVCGRMGSLSDGCSNIIVTYFHNIYNYMKENFNSENVCLLSGECSAQFHVHKVEVTPMSDVGFVNVNDDDLPCELCKQLVGHLRDLLIADTTEAEFKRVLEGLCKQTDNFKNQCLSLVEEYYAVVYSFLVSELNSTQACEMINICPGPQSEFQTAPIAPLLPVESVDKALQLSKPEQPKLIRVGLKKDTTSVKLIKEDINNLQLPIDRLGAVPNVYNRELCTFCQYFLHYVQEELTDPKTEGKIKETVEKACNRLPSSINDTCIMFINTYGEAVVALLAQEIDPSTICPLMQVCPNRDADIEIFMQQTPGDKPNCPLCLFAVTKLEQMIKDSKTRDNIKNALDSLCSHFKGNVATECQDFVNTYTDELVEMMMDDFKPQEVCVYLKVCTDKTPAPALDSVPIVGKISTNEIIDYTENGKFVSPALRGDKPQCVLCEFVMEKLESSLKNQSNEDKIKKIIHGICNDMPKSIARECNQFVDEYADMVLQLLVASVEPKEICTVMKLCDSNKKISTPTISEAPNKNVNTPLCPICKVVMQQVEMLIGTNFTARDVEVAMDKVCAVLPRSQEKDCDKFMHEHRDQIYAALITLTRPGEICAMLFLCEQEKVNAIELMINKCAVCEAAVQAIEKIMRNPRADHSIDHVLEKACRALPRKNQKKCRDMIDEYGPALFNYVAHMADSSTVCKEVRLCAPGLIARPVF